ncbi:hypothetical protein M426DRAFT_325420 [Hypoxylon sp. CI-4A]|nr:hypothetical protein M426DRAFT_325420 [Hypoxylon sp. CI-4A]
MQLTSIIAAAGLVASTNALLLPPEVLDVENTLANTLPIALGPSTSRTLNVKCPGCSIPILHDGEIRAVNRIPSHLVLDFNIETDTSDHATGGSRLMLNGFELYPNADPFRSTLTASVQLDIKNRRTKRPMRPNSSPNIVQPLGFGIQTTPLSSPEGEELLEMVMIDLDIIEVGNTFIQGIPNIRIQLLKIGSDELLIKDILVDESETKHSNPNNPMANQTECTTILCKWKAMMMEKLASLRVHKGCGGRRPAHTKGQEQATPAVDGGDNIPHREQRHRNWGLLFKNIASHILLPVAIGILAGVAASIIGMMAGTFVVFVWRSVVRRGSSRRHHHRHGHHHKASRHEIAVPDEKSGLMTEEEHDEPPPVYVEEGIIVLDDKKDENVA